MNRRVRTWLIVGLLGVQVVTVVAVVLLTRANSRDALSEQMDQALDQASNTAIERTERFLEPASFGAELTAGLVAEDVVAARDEPFLEGSFLEQLRLHDQIAGVYVGYPDGGFVYVNRDDERTEGGSRTKLITVEPDGPSTTLTFRAADGAVIATEPDPDDDYDPRTRPWYADAVGRDRTIWTEPYVFFTAALPGVTTATPVHQGTELVGVVGVDVQLDTLSSFVRSISVSDDGVVFIVDEDGTMVAHPDVGQVMRPDGDGATTVDVRDIDDPLLAAAFDAVDLDQGDEGDQIEASFSFDGEEHRALFTRVRSHDQWYIAVVAPESDFIGAIAASQQVNLLIVVGAGLTLVVLAILLSGVGARWIGRLNERASTDPLTGVLNRRGFDDRLARILKRPNGQITAAVVDLDHFKAINDTHGHTVGDEALRAVADRLRGGVRDDDVVGRLGGDEFAVVLVDADLAVAHDVMERIRGQLEGSPTATSEGPVDVRITVGIAGHRGAMSAAALLEAADGALYLAKRRGRNQVASDTELAGVD